MVKIRFLRWIRILLATFRNRDSDKEENTVTVLYNVEGKIYKIFYSLLNNQGKNCFGAG